MFTPAWLRQALAAAATGGPGPYGELQAPDANGLMLPPGFTSRQISSGGELIGTPPYPWHFAPDGQATFRTVDGGYVLVQNSEAPHVLGGGSSAMRFDSEGNLERAYRILTGSNLNCAGGPTPWGTWLSGEEHQAGMIWEADPAGIQPAVPRPALGNFSHEAAAVDGDGYVYLSEDQGDSLFYRFTPDEPGNLTSGLLQAAKVGAGGAVEWLDVPDPNIVTGRAEVRNQLPDATTFNGGEGLWYYRGIVYYTTKNDRKVWAYDTAAQTIEVVYDGDDPATPSALNAVDNVTVSPSGDVYVCEDGGNMEICMITPDGIVSPFVRLTDNGNHPGTSELTGVVFDPSGTRMYFSSQRSYPLAERPAGAPSQFGVLARGATFEVSGPFLLPAGGVPSDWVYGPPAGERDQDLHVDVDGLGVDVKKASLHGIRASVTSDKAARLHAVVRTFDLKRESRGDGTADRPLPVALGRWSGDAGSGSTDISLGLAALGAETAVLTVVAERSDGTRRVAAQRLELG